MHTMGAAYGCQDLATQVPTHAGWGNTERSGQLLTSPDPSGTGPCPSPPGRCISAGAKRLIDRRPECHRVIEMRGGSRLASMKLAPAHVAVQVTACPGSWVPPTFLSPSCSSPHILPSSLPISATPHSACSPFSVARWSLQNQM